MAKWYPPLVGPQGTAGWAMGLPEQAKGTTAATQNPYQVVNPATYQMPNLGSVRYAIYVKKTVQFIETL